MSPKSNLTLPSPPLTHVPRCHSFASFTSLQGWWLHHFPGQPVPLLGNLFGEEVFPNINPLQAQPEPISSHPVTFLPGRRDWHPPVRESQEASWFCWFKCQQYHPSPSHRATKLWPGLAHTAQGFGPCRSWEDKEYSGQLKCVFLVDYLHRAFCFHSYMSKSLSLNQNSTCEVQETKLYKCSIICRWLKP